MPPRRSTHRRPRTAARLLLLALAGSVALPLSTALPVQAATGTRVNLEVLVVTNGDPSVNAIAVQLDREGVPHTLVDLGSGGRPAIGEEFLVDPVTGAARYQAVVLPNAAPAGMDPAELEALAAYERRFGVRQVNAYVYPGSGTGGSATYAGSLDGATGTVTDAGKADGFSELSGSFPVDDVDPGTLEVYGYLAQPAAGTGERVTPVLTARLGDADGSIAWEVESGGREQLMVSAAYNESMEWFSTVGHGIVSWMTRGVHLGYHRSYFDVQVDDVFLPDGRWSVDGNCTPGDDCVDPGVTTSDIRMTAADVQRLSDWQKAQDFELTMVFNGGGSDAAKAENGGTDALTDAFLARKDEFTWVNHTFTHPYLGCVQIAPTVVGQPWRCATDPTETPRQDPEVPAQESGGLQWASQAYITEQVSSNIDWARANALPRFDATELVTGEHSGLTTTNQPQDNPFLAPALQAAGVTTLASDASREKDARAVGRAVTVPRYPMNIYYNTGTYLDQIDEYNWYYTSRSVGGSGVCDDNPATTTCITPLAAADADQARNSYEQYLKPLEVRNALRRVLADDPRPFYAHQSNLAEDALLLPVVQGVLEAYRATHTADAPLITPTLTEQSRQLSRASAWRDARAGVTAYLDDQGVHVTGPAGTTVPLTVPGNASTTVALEAHGGQRSAWIAAPASDTVLATPGEGAERFGYAGASTSPVPTSPVPTSPVPTSPVPTSPVPTSPVPTSPVPTSPVPTTPVAALPGAPVVGTASSGRLRDRHATATVRWSPPSTGGTPITGYRVTATRLSFLGRPIATVTGPTVHAASARSATVVLPVRGARYRFTVQAVTAAGAGPASAASKAVYAW
ncbi:fibronectin type III domain-containing protein [Kineococcus esterisolvens]|uniref:fibronectin type III domain-containing protein n=1 Tax=unclassified Kineococcus TaxID=2621656 RepID=UPI003D7E8177